VVDLSLTLFETATDCKNSRPTLFLEGTFDNYGINYVTTNETIDITRF
jgi:hypothetical protein